MKVLKLNRNKDNNGNKNQENYNRGITLVVLIVTIVILLLLAGTILNLVIENNGIINKVQEARDKTREAEIIEKIEMMVAGSYQIDGNIDNELLQTNLRTIEGLENIIINKLPIIVEISGNYIKIEKDGNVLPSTTEYIELDYLEGTEREKIELPYQYRNTDEIITIVDNLDSTVYMGNWSDNYLTIGYQIVPRLNIIRIYLGNTWGKYVSCDYTEGIKKISIANGVQKLNDVVVANFTITDSAQSQFNTVPVFGAVHTSWTPFWTYNTGNSRIYRITINRNGNALYDLIPVLDKNQTACLYDKVENKYYYLSI